MRFTTGRAEHDATGPSFGARHGGVGSGRAATGDSTADAHTGPRVRRAANGGPRTGFRDPKEF